MNKKKVIEDSVPRRKCFLDANEKICSEAQALAGCTSRKKNKFIFQHETASSVSTEDNECDINQDKASRTSYSPVKFNAESTTRTYSKKNTQEDWLDDSAYISSTEEDYASFLFDEMIKNSSLDKTTRNESVVKNKKEETDSDFGFFDDTL